MMIMKISIVKMDDYGQVFYIEYCPEENGFKILDKFLEKTFIRDEHLFLEDACHPITPPIIRFRFKDKENADILEKFINENMKYFRYNKCNTSNEWYRGDPNISLMPW